MSQSSQPMTQAFLTADAFTYPVEAGFQADAQDPGNWYGEGANRVLIGTNHGITAPILAAWRGGGYVPTQADMMNLSAAEAQQIRFRLFWLVIAGDQLPNGIGLMLYDDAVDRGPGNAARLLQAAIGVTQDGDVGPITIKGVVTFGTLRCLFALAAQQSAAYGSDANVLTFGQGWGTRLGNRMATASPMVQP